VAAECCGRSAEGGACEDAAEGLNHCRCRRLIVDYRAPAFHPGFAATSIKILYMPNRAFELDAVAVMHWNASIPHPAEA